MESKDYLSELESTITHLEAQQKYDLDKLAKAEKRLEELEEWVKKTGHWQYCDFLEGTPYTCKCGLDNLLRGE